MISKITFLKMISIVTDSVDTWRSKLSKAKDISQSEKEKIIRNNVIVNDTITMLESVTGDKFHIIRDYVFERDADGEYFFAFAAPNRAEAVLISSPAELYRYLCQDASKNDLSAESNTAKSTEQY